MKHIPRRLLLGWVIASLAWGISACSPGKQSTLADSLKHARAIRRQAAMQRSGISQYLAGVDDTARLLYVAMVDGQSQIHSIKPDGSGVTQLTRDPGYKGRPMWNLPHSQIAFFQYPDDRPLGDTVSLMVMQADGSGARAVVSGKRIDARRLRASWKPDSTVLYVQELDFPTILYGYDVATGQQVETIRLPKSSFLTEVHSLSPDMTFLAGTGPAKQDNVMHVGTIKRDGKSETDLMRPFSKGNYQLGTVVWSYDSQLVAFEVDKIIIIMSRSFNLEFEAHTITPQDFSGELSGPAFSPSGDQIACIMGLTHEGQVGSGDQTVATDVWIMNVNGTHQRRLTQDGSCFDPAW
jgi:Tol biopolymer transport system component